MRIEQLEYLTAVTRHGSLRRASEKLHLSQPALSEAISKLERELGVRLLDRRRSGARISREGRELLPYMDEVLDAVERLRASAGDQATAARMVRLGTVNAATASLLVPALSAFQRSHPTTTVEVVTMQQSDIDAGLLEGTLDLGLVNLLDGDDAPVDLVGTDLLLGRPVVVMPGDHPLAAQPAVTVDQVRAEPFVMMRAGYLMHRYAHRLLGGALPGVCHTADGAEMGKALVAEGLGLTVLPDFSVDGDPLERAGLIVARPIGGDTSVVTLVLRRRGLHPLSGPTRDLHATILDHARRHHAARAS